MKYINAADVLPEELLNQITIYIEEGLLYIPNRNPQKRWGEKSGSRQYYSERNREIRLRFKNGHSIDLLAQNYGLACDTIRKIIYAD